MNALAASASLAFAATADVKTTSCQFGGKRSDHVQTGGRQHVDEKHSKLGLAIRNRLNDLSGRGLGLGLSFHCLSDAETFEDSKNLGTSRARGYGSNRLRLEQRPLQRIARANLGLGSPRSDGDAQAYASDIGCRSGNEASLSRGVLENFPRANTNVERPTNRGQLDQFGGGAEPNYKFMAGGTLELRAELFYSGRHRAARQYLNFGSLHIGGRQWHKRQT